MEGNGRSERGLVITLRTGERGVNKMSRNVQTTTCKNSRNRQRPTTCHRSIDRICTQTRKSVLPGIRSKRKERMEMGGLGFALAFYSTGRVFFSVFFFFLLPFFLSFLFFVCFLPKRIGRDICALTLVTKNSSSSKTCLYTLGPSGGRVGGGRIKWNQQSV